MLNIKLILEYDGSFFHGLQWQPGLVTIESELMRVLSTVLRTKIGPIYSAGRTDAGVHARGQVVNFFYEEKSELSLTTLCLAISHILKGKLSVISAEIVPPEFNARKSSHIKEYRYTIFCRNTPPVHEKKKVWHVSENLNVELMIEEAAKITGSHDFTSFRNSGCVSRSPVRDILESSLEVRPPFLIYRVVGRSFLKQMVRNIVGTLVDLGKGRLKADSIIEILEVKDRKAAGITAPPQGLCLEWVRYM